MTDLKDLVIFVTGMIKKMFTFKAYYVLHTLMENDLRVCSEQPPTFIKCEKEK